MKEPLVLRCGIGEGGKISLNAGADAVCELEF